MDRLIDKLVDVLALGLDLDGAVVQDPDVDVVLLQQHVQLEDVVL